MPPEPIGPAQWGIYCPRRGWLADECAGGTWSWDVTEAMWITAITYSDAMSVARARFLANDIVGAVDDTPTASRPVRLR